MLLEPTLDKLNAMKLYGMAEALRRYHETADKHEVDAKHLAAELAEAEWVSRIRARLEESGRAVTRPAICAAFVDARRAPIDTTTHRAHD